MFQLIQSYGVYQDQCAEGRNLINAALETEVEKVVTFYKQGCCTHNLYGATKLTSDKLFIAANNIRGRKTINFRGTLRKRHEV